MEVVRARIVAHHVLEHVLCRRRDDCRERRGRVSQVVVALPWHFPPWAVGVYSVLYSSTSCASVETL